jgi:RNA polymerase sigma factor (sigma-70 family)
MERPDVEKIWALLQEFRQGGDNASHSFLQMRECLVQQYTRRIFVGCRVRGVPEDDCADIVQEIFISIYSSLPKFTGDALGLHSWILKIVDRRITDYFRRLPKLEQLKEWQTISSGQPEDLEKNTIDKDEGEWARRALLRLPQRYQEVIKLELLDKLSRGDIAAYLGIKNPDYFRTLRKRVIDRWRQEIERLKQEGTGNGR